MIYATPFDEALFAIEGCKQRLLLALAEGTPVDTMQEDIEKALNHAARASELVRHIRDDVAHGLTATLPVEPAQYLFAVNDADFDLWTLTTHGWFGNGCAYASPLERKPYTTWQRVVRGAK